ncbi:aldo/keto reductase [Mycolicibacterium sp. BiH015]|uniref:aldo/keto reductase n=1 Tax=Mycolicibacterium sp. BiH015 TaxID=3018808 RepID=UPI0022E96202|nr:aldo/keto reductase [Mycolicibacterium sp. BiH015]MDA2893456.1 aldo/keto reductase [Mycolicibacterium sp. BiH015]
MRYRLLGNSGLRVSEVCLGTMTFGTDFGWGADEKTSRQLYDAFREQGGNFVDTANEIYTNGTSETFVGRFIADHRDEVVLATKYSDAPLGSDPNRAGNHRKSMVQSVERSLTRLGTDRIDLLWVHAWDFLTPEGEVMRALDDLVRQGKILYAGISDAPAWVIARCNTLAEIRGWTPFVAVQAEYSLVERTPERELIPMSRALDLGVLGWSPLANGVLTGKHSRTHEEGSGGGERLKALQGVFDVDDRKEAIAGTVVEVAGQVGCSPAQVAIAWVRSRGVMPILGARKTEQLHDNLGALAVSLDSQQIAQLERASAIDLGFPHDFLAKTRGGPTYGGRYVDIDPHVDRGIGNGPIPTPSNPAAT